MSKSQVISGFGLSALSAGVLFGLVELFSVRRIRRRQRS